MDISYHIISYHSATNNTMLNMRQETLYNITHHTTIKHTREATRITQHTTWHIIKHTMVLVCGDSQMI